MSGTRTRTIVFLTALVFCMASLLVGAYADTRDTGASVNLVINYPAYPLIGTMTPTGPGGGPYIVAATYFPDATTPRVVLVFNEDIDEDSIDEAQPPSLDFTSTTMDLALMAYDAGEVTDQDNVIYLTFPGGMPAAGFDPSGVEILAMKPGELQSYRGDATDQSWNIDITPITIGDGPVVTRCFILDRQNDFNNPQTVHPGAPVVTGPDDNRVVVHFDAPVRFVSTDEAAFGQTIEFNGLLLQTSATPSASIEISRAAANPATAHFLAMHPGVMNLRVAAGTIRWDAHNVTNAALSFRQTENDPLTGGPLLNAVYLNTLNGDPDDDYMAIVFDQAVTSSEFPITPVDNEFVTSGWSVSDGSVGSWFSSGWTNVLKASGFTIDEGVGLNTLALRPPDEFYIRDLYDYQLRLAVNPVASNDPNIEIPVPVWDGPGIVRAAYDDNLSPNDYDDDQLFIFLSEPIRNFTELRPAHFTLEGFAFGDNPTWDYAPGNPDQFARFIIRNFTRSTGQNPYEQGCRIIPTDPRLPVGGLPVIIGDLSENPLHDTPQNGAISQMRWIPVVDESRPSRLTLTDTHEVIDDAWEYDLVREVYTLYLRFREDEANGGGAGLEDSDQYFLFPVLESREDFWSEALMAARLDKAIPLGNVRPRQIDDVTRLAIYASTRAPDGNDPPGTIYTTIEGDVLYSDPVTRPLQRLSFLLAAADWQGNCSRIEVPNDQEWGWTWLHPQPRIPNLRVYIQPEYCGGAGIETGEVRLYGLHFIHDYEVDRVRFEWLKEEGTADQCDDATDEDWEPIATVGGVNQRPSRGDPLMYRSNSGDPGAPPDARDDLHELRSAPPAASREFTYPVGTGTWYSYYDADRDGIYSARDAVVRDADRDGKFDDVGDVLVIGSDGFIETIPDQADLTRFTTYSDDSAANPAYYWVDTNVTPGHALNPTSYIFRENRENYVDYGNDLPVEVVGLNLWQVNWEPCTNRLHGEDDGGDIGYSGEYIVRCIAIDRSNNEDVIDQHCYEYADNPPDDYPWNPNEIEPVTIDCSEIAIDLTTVQCYVPTYACENGSPTTWSWTVVTLDLDTTVPIVDQVPAGTRFLKINAVPDVPVDEVLGVRFFGNLWGNVVGEVGNWNGNFSPNPDGDTYADLDMVPGYQYRNGYAPYLDDERIDDANGNFIFDAGDVVLDMGRDDEVSTPVGQILIPLVLEDYNEVTPVTPLDNDHDGNVLDSSLDDDMLDPLTAYAAYWDLGGVTFGPHWTGTINATVARERPACPAGLQTDTDTENVEFDNWSPPLVDVIRVENEDDQVIDVWHPVADGDEYGIYGPDPTPGTPRTWLVHVTAEDPDGIAWVRLWYRVNPACGGTPTPWMCVQPQNFDLTLPPWDEYPDETYPYEFHWLMGALDDVDANYQFYAEAMDNDGNLSGIPVYPYGFGFNQYAGIELAHVVPIANADRCEDGPLVNVGDEYLLTAELDDPTMEGDVQVRFYHAPRIQGEMHTTADIDEMTGRMDVQGYILDPTNGGLVVCVNGSEYSDANYTAVPGTRFITFTTPPTAGAEITVNYNISRQGGSWRMIALGDDVAPYTVEWEEGTGDPSGVPPFPPPGETGGVVFTTAADGKPAWDLCAVALIDVDGDGVYDPGSLCDLMEPIRSEDGNHILLNLVARPIVHLYGLDYEPAFFPLTPSGGWHYTQQLYWPGNPFGPSVAGNAEGKLSGKEADVFVTASAAMPAVIDSVRLAMYKEFHSEPYKWIPMTRYMN
ncbi:MAG: hypothetical protein FJY88_10630, partial [Candidatus Eisenbacteria bacterium]|nr:hypothetical protein [Candidatus Eisenbacteria bacterium]